MNTVLCGKKKKKAKTFTARELIERNYKASRSAFIGSIGPYVDELFLVSYSNIMLARKPNMDWRTASKITVERFVDVEIQVV